MKITGFGYLIKEGLKNVWNNRLMSIASICVLMSCLVLTGSAVLMSMNVDLMVKKAIAQNETRVFLDMDISRVEAVYVGRDIEALENVQSVKYLSKDDTIKEFKSYLGEDIFDHMKDDNPLPDVYKVTMVDLSKYNETVNEIEAIDGVDTISTRSGTAKKLTSVNNLVQILSICIIIALAVISLFIISNTLRATMHSRRFEISIMKSVGATNAFVRIPFVVEGMVIGLISAIVSTGALYFLYSGVVGIVLNIFKFTDPVAIESVIWYVLAIFVIAGITIGALSGFISIRKYLKKEGNEILGW
ncbi:MAG: permease-like cell division protein FtsX [Oscillospiraceae bacterium]|nr:permease-like cell division protein FtsX [Oscillospiraceae bacterium]